jgi:hypothetical protein
MICQVRSVVGVSSIPSKTTVVPPQTRGPNTPWVVPAAYATSKAGQNTS